jgi:hypothetical protein
MKSAAVSDRRLELFVFIRVQLWLECAKQILWKSLVDAFAAALEDKLPWVVIDESIPSFTTAPKSA